MRHAEIYHSREVRALGDRSRASSVRGADQMYRLLGLGDLGVIVVADAQRSVRAARVSALSGSCETSAMPAALPNEAILKPGRSASGDVFPRRHDKRSRCREDIIEPRETEMTTTFKAATESVQLLSEELLSEVSGGVT